MRFLHWLALPLILTGCLSPLHHAAQNGDVAEIQRLIASGANPNAVNENLDKWTPLASAAASGQVAAIRALIAGGADPLFRCAAGTARQIALQFGHQDAAEVLRQAELARGGSSDSGPAAATAQTARAFSTGLLGAMAAPAPAPQAPVADPGGRLGLGLGTTQTGTLVVNAVLPGSPAAEAGFQQGDRILSVGEQSVQTLTLRESVALLRGAPGTSVSVTYQRGDASPIMVQLTRVAPTPAMAASAAALTAPAAPAAPSVPAAPAAVASVPAPAPASDVDFPKSRGAERPDDFALIIGIENYQSLPAAKYGVHDAEAVRRQLAALGLPQRNMISLEGSAATGSKIKSYVQEWLPRNLKPDSTLFVYYSGHGAPDPKAGDAYLVPWDGDPQFLKSTAYPLKELYADLAKTRARRVVVALDSCFSGAGGRSVLADGARPLVVKVDDGAPTAGNLTVLAAASGDEITGTLNDQGHGLFTYYFLKGLSGAAKNASGEVTPESLFRYLTPKVEDEARRQNREQTPTLSGGKGDEPLTRD